MSVIGVDPGPTESTFVMLSPSLAVVYAVTLLNEEARAHLAESSAEAVAIEQMRGFGIMASDGMFDTCAWSGRFFEAAGPHRSFWVPRKIVSKHITGNSGVSHDKFIREALITRYGGKDAAVGKKASPGPLYGISGHAWAALAVGITYWETMRKPGLRVDPQKEKRNDTDDDSGW